MSFQEMKSWLLLEVETLEDTCRFSFMPLGNQTQLVGLINLTKNTSFEKEAVACILQRNEALKKSIEATFCPVQQKNFTATKQLHAGLQNMNYIHTWTLGSKLRKYLTMQLVGFNPVERYQSNWKENKNMSKNTTQSPEN